MLCWLDGFVSNGKFFFIQLLDVGLMSKCVVSRYHESMHELIFSFFVMNKNHIKEKPIRKHEKIPLILST